MCDIGSSKAYYRAPVRNAHAAPFAAGRHLPV